MTGDHTGPNARLIAELFVADGTFSRIGIAIDALDTRRTVLRVGTGMYRGSMPQISCCSSAFHVA